MITYKQLRRIIEERAKNKGLEIVSPSSTISWLYPGQFAYCLNEEFIWDRYGSLIDMPGEIHFHKIQPVIRWDDYIIYFLGRTKNPPQSSTDHLTSFDMSTIDGGHIINKENYAKYSKMIFGGIVSFLINDLGLDKNKLEITYFSGEKLSILSSNKKGVPRFDFEKYIPEDKEAKEELLSLGLQESQIKPNNTRDCFLIPDWLCGEAAPWGYRNEINYRTNAGLIDIATIERLFLRPIYKNGKLVDVVEWDKRFLINGAGLERLVMVVNSLPEINQVDTINPLFDFIASRGYDNVPLLCESLRTSHRIIADSRGNLTDKRSPGKSEERRWKYNKILRNLIHVQDIDIRDFYNLNAELQPHYEELSQVVELAVEEVKQYKEKLENSGFKID
ncbi:MAG TPA: hypothetical protein VJH20_00390 [Candidatus Nanoarchaeia archaeon]|nr:hypothetical protein [Candidatus Nanoarchaeia archaeon]